MNEPRIVPPDEARAYRDRLAALKPGERTFISTPPRPLDLAHTAAILGEQREAALALHHAGWRDFITDPDCAREECDHEDGCPTERLAICAGCDRQYSEIDNYYLERTGGYEAVKWPCPTARALEVTE